MVAEGVAAGGPVRHFGGRFGVAETDCAGRDGVPQEGLDCEGDEVAQEGGDTA